MRHHLRHLIAVSLLCTAATAAGCSDDASTAPGGSTGDTGTAADTASADTGSANDTASADTASADASPTDASPTDTSTADTAVPQAALADRLALTGVEAFQSVETTLLDGDQPVDAAVPLVAGRQTLFRLLVTPQPDWTPREVTAELVLHEPGRDADEVLSDTRAIAAASSDADRASAFEIAVPGDRIGAQTQVAFRLLGHGQPADEATDHQARWPRDGSTHALGATTATGTLHLVIVPIRYDSDGSGRMPDTSDAQIGGFRDAVRALYPAHQLRLEVREPIAWTGRMRFGDINRELRTLKQNDGNEHAYYYGVISPADSFEDYCSGTCTTGQSFTVSSADATSYRVGAGLGFNGERWAWTLVHELGHMHGRGHAPCGVSSWSDDNAYPYGGGEVGVWGWDSRTDTLFGPNDANDFMGYCDDPWVSDYTYLGIMDRMEAAATLQNALRLPSEPHAYRWINWSDDRPPAWGDRTIERDPTTGRWATARFIDAAGRTLATRQIPLVDYAHDGARSVLVPEAPAGAAAVEITAEGRAFGLDL